jgi:hypothetical protein
MAMLPTNDQHSDIEVSDFKRFTTENRLKQPYNGEPPEDHPVDADEESRNKTTTAAAAASEASDIDSVNDGETIEAKMFDKDFDSFPSSSPLWKQAARGDEIHAQLSHDPENLEKAIDKKDNETLQDIPSFPNEPATKLKQRSTVPTVVRKAEVSKEHQRRNYAESHTSTLEPDNDCSSEDDQFAFPSDDFNSRASESILHSRITDRSRKENQAESQKPSRRHHLSKEFKSPSDPSQNIEPKLDDGSNVVAKNSSVSSSRKRSYEDEDSDTDSVEIIHASGPAFNKENRPYGNSNYVTDWKASRNLKSISQKFMNDEKWTMVRPDNLVSSAFSVPKAITVPSHRKRRRK